MRAPTIGLLLARLIGLRLAAGVMLRLPRILIGLRLAPGVRLRLRFAAERRIPRMILLGVFEALLARLAFWTEIRLALPELLLGGGNQPEIVLRVLVVVFGRHRIAGRLSVAGELDVFFGDVRSRSADFHIGTVRLVDPGQWVLALAVAPAHAFVLTVSHGSFVYLLPFAAVARLSSAPGRIPLLAATWPRPAGASPRSGLRLELDRCHDNRSNLFAATHAALLPTPYPARSLERRAPTC